MSKTKSNYSSRAWQKTKKTFIKSLFFTYHKSQNCSTTSSSLELTDGSRSSRLRTKTSLQESETSKHALKNPPSLERIFIWEKISARILCLLFYWPTLTKCFHGRRQAKKISLWNLMALDSRNSHFRAQKHVLILPMRTISNAQVEFQNIFFKELHR